MKNYSDYPFNRPKRISLSPEWIQGATLWMNV
nr:MAG TPA: Putative ABC-transporter type IV [Caudoviricetes sp.]